MVCNTGVGLTPTVDGEVHHFSTRGIFNGLSMLGDEETETIWNHITGRAVYGPLKGSVLPVFNLLHVTAEQALERYPGLPVAISDRPVRGRRGMFAPIADRIPFLRDGFRSTIVKEDTRLGTMDIGLGIWTDSEQRYYPMEVVQAGGGAIVDVFDGRRLVVYVEPGIYGLDAFFTEEQTASTDGTLVTVGEDSVLENGVLRDSSGERIGITRPLQLFSRWYGFALTFPETTIYGR
ncbi:MAG TPA: DUF3179 domain-containing protein [Gemmatimonadetes bacterium]|nr:hypothetical protein [Gemmatimonadota bacterium]HIC52737.1 DUF3179 domain-containing protein [Gemmatimonadota bacterium]HIN50275.1 DUF3179 domain-containing protein [Gemmatimonadota bacterium]